mmetsp:Transcript_44171/g.138410  ORF Transcript_44171/g.138410 Transcript_44171/m.138410 type:complete len:394 (-) Transcript_44171:292-1473(-)
MLLLAGGCSRRATSKRGRWTKPGDVRRLRWHTTRPMLTLLPSCCFMRSCRVKRTSRTDSSSGSGPRSSASPQCKRHTWCRRWGSDRHPSCTWIAWSSSGRPPWRIPCQRRRPVSHRSACCASCWRRALQAESRPPALRATWARPRRWLDFLRQMRHGAQSLRGPGAASSWPRASGPTAPCCWSGHMPCFAVAGPLLPQRRQSVQRQLLGPSSSRPGRRGTRRTPAICGSERWRGPRGAEAGSTRGGARPSAAGRRQLRTRRWRPCSLRPCACSGRRCSKAPPVRSCWPWRPRSGRSWHDWRGERLRPTTRCRPLVASVPTCGSRPARRTRGGPQQPPHGASSPAYAPAVAPRATTTRRPSGHARRRLACSVAALPPPVSPRSCRRRRPSGSLL